MDNEEQDIYEHIIQPMQEEQAKEQNGEMIIIEEPTFKVGDIVIATGYSVYTGKPTDNDYVKYGFKNAQFVLMTGTLVDLDDKVATIRINNVDCVFDANKVVLYDVELYNKVKDLYDGYVKKSVERDMLIEDIKNILYCNHYQDNVS